MKLYRQTARVVLFGLIVASMVFGVRGLAGAMGVGPEPPSAKCGKSVPGAPWVVDVEMYFIPDASDATQGTATIIANVVHKKHKYVKSGSGHVYLEQFQMDTTKEALSQCVVNFGDFENELGEPMPDGTLFSPFTVGGYKFDPIGFKVSARIIYGLVLPE
jgi:hypothetical protein